MAIEYRALSDEEIEVAVMKRIEADEPFWPDELAQDIGADPFDVIRVCEGLVAKGLIKGLDPEEVPRRHE